MPSKHSKYQLFKDQVEIAAPKIENFGAFSLQGALKTPNYGNQSVLQMFESEDAGVNDMQRAADIAAGITPSADSCILGGGGCNSCSKKYKKDIKRFYSGVL